MRLPSSDATPPDFGALATIVQRTQTRSWALDLDAVPEELLSFIEQEPGALAELVGAWEGVVTDCPPASLTEGQRRTLGQAALPAQQGWVRQVAHALFPLPTLQDATDVRPDQLSALVDQDATWRAVSHWSGLAKDGAMDLRAMEAAFGWFLVQQVVDAIKRRLKGLDRDGQSKLLGDFGPMLALLGQVQEEMAQGRLSGQEARTDAEADADAAEQEAQDEETLLSLRSGERVPKEELAEVAARRTQRGAGALPSKRRGRKAPR